MLLLNKSQIKCDCSQNIFIMKILSQVKVLKSQVILWNFKVSALSYKIMTFMLSPKSKLIKNCHV